MMNPFEEGQVILVNKPLHWTSADVVKKIRNRVHAKVGHAGTLDPLATGLLILCTGKFTKRINEFMSQEKEYTGTLPWVPLRPSFDLETKPKTKRTFLGCTAADLEKVCQQFTGEIIQVPPVYSAIKKDGKRSYDLAQAGKSCCTRGQKSDHKGISTCRQSICPWFLSAWFVQQEPIYEVWPMMWARCWDAALISVRFAGPGSGNTGSKMRSDPDAPEIIT